MRNDEVPAVAGEAGMSAPDGLVGVGRTADVVADGDDRVRRTYRDGTDAAPEAALMRFLAARGYPVPAVLDVDGPALVLERLEADSLADRMLDGRIGPAAAGAIVGGALRELHAAIVDGAPELARVGDLASSAAGPAIVHLDLHPENVLFRGDEWRIIDWRNAALGPAGLDVAMTLLVVRTSDAAAAAGTAFVEAFEAGVVDAYGSDPEPWMDAAIERRLQDPNLNDAERRRLGLMHRDRHGGVAPAT